MVPPPIGKEQEMMAEAANKVLSSIRRGMLSSPLHILIYGRQHHRQDGFSIVNQDNTHTSHVHVSDAETIEEVELLDAT